MTQGDVVFGTLTVRESVMYSATLRVPDKTTKDEKIDISDTTIQEMGLSECQHTGVGSFSCAGSAGVKSAVSALPCRSSVDLPCSPGVTSPALALTGEECPKFFSWRMIQASRQGTTRHLHGLHFMVSSEGTEW